MILRIFSPKNLAKILAFFAQTTASFCKNVIITLVFEKTPFFRRKLAKIAENCDHSIDPSASLHRLLAFLSLSFFTGGFDPGFAFVYHLLLDRCSALFIKSKMTCLKSLPMCHFPFNMATN
jgi:hypothetical protein